MDEFEQILKTNFSYPQPWWIPGRGFLFMHTRYAGGRGLFWMTSPNGVNWDKAQKLAHIDMGDYQISWRNGVRLATIFDYHPKPLGLNERANIYYVETEDYGKTWRTVNGEPVALPLTNAQNSALVLNSRTNQQLVYLKDLNFDAEGRPVILYLTTTGYESGPKHGLREWFTLRWSGREWIRQPFTSSDHNYDHGSLYIEPDGLWRIIAPTDPGPQPWTTGGEMVMWASTNQGVSWSKVKQLTRNSAFNHTYARRPVNAHPDFYSIWADGNPLEQSGSSLYFTSRGGERVWRLPSVMQGNFAKPDALW